LSGRPRQRRRETAIALLAIAATIGAIVTGCAQIFGIDHGNEVDLREAGGNDGSPAGDASIDAPRTDATADATLAADGSAEATVDAASDAGPLADQEASVPILLVTRGSHVDTILSDGEKMYWREEFYLGDDAGAFSVAIKSCPLDGGCADGGDLLGSALSELVFLSDRALTIVGTTLFATTGDAVVSCDVGGCGGNPATVYANPSDGFGSITSLTSAGRTLLLARTGFAGHRFLYACDIADCSNPTSLIATQGAPSEPSLAAGLVAFQADGIYVCSISSGCPDGAPPLATYVGTIGGSLWNDGTNVYFTLTGTAFTDDAGNNQITNATGTLARCGVNGCNGVPTTLAADLDQPSSVLVDGTAIYWVNDGVTDFTNGTVSAGSVQRCSTTDDCKTVETISRGGNPTSLTVDGKNIYWGDGTSGAIYARAK
jgi:hypothetical protein